MIDTLGRLVEYPSVTEDREANHELLDHVGGFLAEHGMHIVAFENVDPESNEVVRSLIATTRPNALDSKVMIASHLDVVPTTSAAAFAPDIKGDKFYGRGALDMKFNVAATMEIIKDIFHEGTLSQYDLAVMLTTYEEKGGRLDTEWVLDKYGYRPEVCILPDGGDNWQIQTGSKGFLHYQIRGHGLSAHSRDPSMGSNAILSASRAMLAVQDLFPPAEETGSHTNSNSPNMMHGGRAANQVPDEAVYSLDARFISEAEKQRLRNEMGKICLAHDAEMVVQVDGVATHFDLADPYIAPFRRLVTQVTGIEVNGSQTLGSSDARFFAQYGIPVISLYPTGGGHHSENEWISVKALSQYKEILRTYLDQMAVIPKLTPEAAAKRNT